MGWREAIALVRELLGDPTSHTAAAIAGWEYPCSRETAALADLIDLIHHAHTDPKKRSQITPYPRPNQNHTQPVDGPSTARYGRPARSQAEILEALAARGHARG